MPTIRKALKCPQHSSQVFLRNRSKSANVDPVVTSRCIQYSGRRSPSTRRWNFLVFRPFRDLWPFFAVAPAPSSLCRHVSRCLVIPDLLNSRLQKTHWPGELILGIVFLLLNYSLTSINHSDQHMLLFYTNLQVGGRTTLTRNCSDLT